MITSIQDVIVAISGLLKLVVPLVLAIALLVFLWGLVVFIAKSGDEKAIEEGRKKMIWGVVGLFVALSVWGLVSLLQSELFGSPNSTTSISVEHKTLNSAPSNTDTGGGFDEPCGDEDGQTPCR